MSDVLVIGAGVGGLSAAIASAAEGHRVLVLEAAAQAGGKLDAVELDGLRLDTGPSVLTLPEVFDELLALAGEPPLERVRPARWLRYRFADGLSLELGHGLAGALDGVRAALGARAAGDLESFLDQARRAWDAAAARFVFGDAPGLADVLRAPGDLFRLRPFRTLLASIRAQVKDPHLRDVLARFATYAGSDAHRAPAVLGTIAWVELGLGGFGLPGGMSRLRERLLSAARRLRVEFRFGSAAGAVEVRGGAVRAALLPGGERLAADAIVFNGEPAALFGHLLPAELQRRVPGEPSWSARTAIFRTRARADRFAHEVIFPREYLREHAALSAGREPLDPAIYFCAPRIAHEAPAWEGQEPLFALVNAPAGARASAGWVEATRARLELAGALEGGEEPAWAREPDNLAARFPCSGGALYGAASHGWRTAFARPPNRVRGVRRLYLAGGGAHPGAGLPLVAASGRAAARALCRDLARVAVAAAVVLVAFLSSPAAQAATSSEPPVCAAARRELGSLEREPAAAQRARSFLRGVALPCARLLAAEVALAEAGVAPEGRRAGLLAEAVERARAALAADPGSPRARFVLAVSEAARAKEEGLLALLRASPEVRRLLDEAAEIEARRGTPTAATLTALCSLYHHAPGAPLAFGDRERAGRYCAQALALDARSWEAHEVLAEQARSRGDDEAARSHLAAILDGPLDPNAPRTHARYRREAREIEESLR